MDVSYIAKEIVMIKSVRVSKTGRIGLRLVEDGPVVMIPVEAPPGAMVLIDTEKATQVGEPYVAVNRETGAEKLMARGTAMADAIVYEPVVPVGGRPPKFLDAQLAARKMAIDISEEDV